MLNTPPPARGKPHILFLMSDQHTQKVTGCYGDAVVRTPHLDRLASRGVVFDNAYCPSPICTPSRMSLLTARWPSSQSCWTNADMLPSDIPTYLHALGAAGYRPALVGRLHAIGPDQLHGYAEREVGDHSSNWVGATTHDMGVLNRTNDPFRTSLERSGQGQSSYELHDVDVADAACQWLSRYAQRAASGDTKQHPFALGARRPAGHRAKRRSVAPWPTRQRKSASTKGHARRVGRHGLSCRRPACRRPGPARRAGPAPYPPAHPAAWSVRSRLRARAVVDLLARPRCQ